MVNAPLLLTKMPPLVVFNATKFVTVVVNGRAGEPTPALDDKIRSVAVTLFKGAAESASLATIEPAAVSVTVEPATVQESVISPGVAFPAVAVMATLPSALMP